MFYLDTNVVIYALNRRRPLVWDRLSQDIASKSRLLAPSIVLFDGASPAVAASRRWTANDLVSRLQARPLVRACSRAGAFPPSHAPRSSHPYVKPQRGSVSTSRFVAIGYTCVSVCVANGYRSF